MSIESPTPPESHTDAPRLPQLKWRLHTVMSERGIRTAAELHRRLQPYGLTLTHSQLTRIIAQLPMRLNTQVLSALMLVLNCDASDLLQLPSANTIKRRPRKSTLHPSAAPLPASPLSDGDRGKDPPSNGATASSKAAEKSSMRTAKARSAAVKPEWDELCGPSLLTLVRPPGIQAKQ